MDEKKKNIVIMGILIFFIIFIGWGIFQTAVKLSQKKQLGGQAKKIVSISPGNKEAKKETPQQQAAPKPINPPLPIKQEQHCQLKPLRI